MVLANPLRAPPALARQPAGWQRRTYTLHVVAAAGQKHFHRPSLYYGGLAEPTDVLQHCLTLFRRARVAEIVPFLELPCAGAQGAASAAALVGGQLVKEAGPLAPLAGVLDVGARRVLPGHLLRRSRVLSTLRLGPSFQQRVALTACTGEEAVLEWTLREVPGSVGSSSSSSSDEEGGWAPGALLPAAQAQRDPLRRPSPPPRSQSQQQGPRQPAGGSPTGPAGLGSSGDEGSLGGSSPGVEDGSRSSAEGSGSRWVVTSVRRDGSCDEPLPTTPHPKAAPEAVVKAQLVALQQGDIFGASCFNIWKSHASGFGLGIHYELMRDKLAVPPYDVLLRHAEAYLGPAALPSQRVMLQEAVVLGGAGHSGRSARFVWRLGMQQNSCWLVTGISLLDTF